MAIVDLIMPKMGESIMEATILRWHKKVGDSVHIDETVLDIATDKVDSEIPSTVEGMVTEIIYPVNAVVPVGSVIAKIQTEVVSKQPVPQTPQFAPFSTPTEKTNAPVAQVFGTNQPSAPLPGFQYPQPDAAYHRPIVEPLYPAQQQQPLPSKPGNNKFYSPLVLNIANSEGISLSELERVQGTGADGRVSKKDILQYIAERKSSIRPQQPAFPVHQQFAQPAPEPYLPPTPSIVEPYRQPVQQFVPAPLVQPAPPAPVYVQAPVGASFIPDLAPPQQPVRYVEASQTIEEEVPFVPVPIVSPHDALLQAPKNYSVPLTNIIPAEQQQHTHNPPLPIVQPNIPTPPQVAQQTFISQQVLEKHFHAHEQLAPEPIVAVKETPPVANAPLETLVDKIPFPHPIVPTVAPVPLSTPDFVQTTGILEPRPIQPAQHLHAWPSVSSVPLDVPAQPAAAPIFRESPLSAGLPNDIRSNDVHSPIVETPRTEKTYQEQQPLEIKSAQSFASRSFEPIVTLPPNGHNEGPAAPASIVEMPDTVSESSAPVPVAVPLSAQAFSSPVNTGETNVNSLEPLIKNGSNGPKNNPVSPIAPLQQVQDKPSPNYSAVQAQPLEKAQIGAASELGKKPVYLVPPAATNIPLVTLAEGDSGKFTLPSDVQPSGNVEILEMDRMRKTIAKHMLESVQTSPHVTSFSEADVTNMVTWRERVKDDFGRREGVRLTYTPMFLDCLVKVLKKYPLINASIDGDKIVIKKDINIGVATALPNGNLIVPVVKGADKLNIVGLSSAVNKLANSARDNQLKPEDVSGGTFTFTNVGTFGTLMGTPIIHQPQVAILSVGVIKKRPVVIESPTNDTIGIRHMMYLSLSHDHRLIDGALGAMFLNDLSKEFENWDINRTWYHYL